MQMNLQ